MCFSFQDLRHTVCLVENIYGEDLVNYMVVVGKEKAFCKISAMGIKYFLKSSEIFLLFLWIRKSFVKSKISGRILHTLIEPSRSMGPTEALASLRCGGTAVCSYKGQPRNKFLAVHPIYP